MNEREAFQKIHGEMPESGIAALEWSDKRHIFGQGWNAALTAAKHGVVVDGVEMVLVAAPCPNHDGVILELMTERDSVVEMADKLAEKIADLESLDIGEHSSGNCPWTNALNGESQEPS